MTAEEKYRHQLVALGTWQDAFAPEVHTLCMMERELRRELKDWRDEKKLLDGNDLAQKERTAVRDSASRQYQVILALRRDILAHRDALGLTPRGLQRLRGKDAPADAGGASGVQRAENAFAALMDRVKGYE